MFESSLIFYVIPIFVLAGLAKGIVGNGLPIISIALLTMVLGLQEAIAIAVIPAFATNIWQASNGGHFIALIKRLWPYLLASIIAVAFGTKLLIALDQSLLTIILGVVVTVYSAMGIAGKELVIPPKWEKPCRTDIWCPNRADRRDDRFTCFSGHVLFEWTGVQA